MVVAAFVWHWWISVFLVALAVLATLGVVARYLATVVRPQHPGRRQGRQRTARP